MRYIILLLLVSVFLTNCKDKYSENVNTVKSNITHFIKKKLDKSEAIFIDSISIVSLDTLTQLQEDNTYIDYYIIKSKKITEKITLLADDAKMNIDLARLSSSKSEVKEYINKFHQNKEEYESLKKEDEYYLQNLDSFLKIKLNADSIKLYSISVPATVFMHSTLGKGIYHVNCILNTNLDVKNIIYTEL